MVVVNSNVWIFERDGSLTNAGTSDDAALISLARAAAAAGSTSNLVATQVTVDTGDPNQNAAMNDALGEASFTGGNAGGVGDSITIGGVAYQVAEIVPTNTTILVNGTNMGTHSIRIVHINVPSGADLNLIFMTNTAQSNAGITDPSNDLVTFNLGNAADVSTGETVGFGFTASNYAVPCFVLGSSLLAADGNLVAVEKLRAGDRLKLYSGADGIIRWIGQHTVLQSEIALNPKLAPVRISAGALGGGLPQKDLWVSRQHRMLIRSEMAKMLTGHEDVLIAAARLVGLPGINTDNTFDHVTYFHILLDGHEIIYAEGAPTESLFLSPRTLSLLGNRKRQELADRLPELFETKEAQVPAMPIPANSIQKKIALDLCVGASH